MRGDLQHTSFNCIPVKVEERTDPQERTWSEARGGKPCSSGALYQVCILLGFHELCPRSIIERPEQHTSPQTFFGCHGGEYSTFPFSIVHKILKEVRHGAKI